IRCFTNIGFQKTIIRDILQTLYIKSKILKILSFRLPDSRKKLIGFCQGEVAFQKDKYPCKEK
ncbi:MAG TPA: hypothetical protein PKL92_01285, partial [Aquaticitalea sp.]|nr:hypothetical protein [Aquaticitalea sp.]